MMHYSAGLVISGSEGCVHVRIWSEHYYIGPEDLGMLLFVGDHVLTPEERTRDNRHSPGIRLGLAQSLWPGCYHFHRKILLHSAP